MDQPGYQKFEDAEEPAAQKQPAPEDDLSINIANVVGTIPTFEKERMKRLIFRLSRANALVDFKDLR